MIRGSLAAALDRAARAANLVVCVDYDGTLAPIVGNPSRAFPLPGAGAALLGLAELPDTTVAVISGRSRADLAVLSGFSSAILLVGSHGSEFDDGLVARLTPEQLQLHDRLVADLGTIVGSTPGAEIEIKPASVATHVRRCSRPDAARVLAEVDAGPASLPGVQVTRGKEVVELAVLETDKGRAVDLLRETYGASAVIFLGDDVTDEKAFARLRPDADVGIKVGSGSSGAQFRVDDVSSVLDVLRTLADLRIGSR